MVALKNERGFTLFELVIVIGLIASLAMMFAVPLMSSINAQSIFEERQINDQLTLARELAASNGGEENTGSTVQFETGATDKTTVVYLLKNRPMYNLPQSAKNSIQFIAKVQPQVINAKMTLRMPDGSAIATPFAIFISPSGHRSGASGDWKPSTDGYKISKNVAAEPPCNLFLELSFGVMNRRIPIGCS